MKLNNNKERIAFLESYKEWELIYDLSDLGIEIYSYKLNNGTQIVAVRRYEVHEEVMYCVFNREAKDEYLNYTPINRFALGGHSKNQVIEYLKNNKEEI